MLMLQDEPLMDDRLPDRIRLARALLGRRTSIGTVTNGTLLTAAMTDALAAGGIDRVAVSIDAVRPETHSRVRHGEHFQRVVENTLRLIERLGPDRVTVRFLRQRENEGEESEFLDYWGRHRVRVFFTEPCNRAGRLESYERIRKRRPDPWKKLIYPLLNRLVPACPLPFSTMGVLWDGRAII